MPTQYGLRFSRFDGILMHTEKIICYISDMKKPPEFNLKIYIKTLQIKKKSLVTSLNGSWYTEDLFSPWSMHSSYHSV